MTTTTALRRCLLSLASAVLLGSSAGAAGESAQDLPATDAAQLAAAAGQLHQYDISAVLKAGCGSFISYPRAVGCYSRGIEEINDPALNTAKGICGEIGGVSGRTCYEKAMKQFSAPVFVDTAKTKEVVLKMCAASMDSDCFVEALAAAKGEFEPVVKKCVTGYWAQPSQKACFMTSLGG